MNIRPVNTQSGTCGSRRIGLANRDCAGFDFPVLYTAMKKAFKVLVIATLLSCQFVIAQTPVPAPLNIKASSACGYVNVTYVAKPAATFIKIYYRITGSNTDSVLTFPYPAGIPEFAGFGSGLGFLTPQATYQIRVQQLIGAGAEPSAISEPVTVTNTVPVPIVTGMRVDSITSKSATISWDAMPGATGYDLQVYDLSTTPPAPHGFSLTTNTRKLEFLPYIKPNTEYEYKIRYYTSTCGSDYSSARRFTTLTELPRVANARLDTATLTSNSAVVRWDLVPGATSYNVSYKESFQTTLTKVEVASNNHQLNNLTPDKVYQVQISPVRGTEIFPSTQITPFITLATANIPKNLRSSNISSSSATVSWDAMGGTYNVQFRRTGTSSFTTINTTSASANLANLAANASYEFKVQNIVFTAAGRNATSEYSPLANFQTFAAVPVFKPLPPKLPPVIRKSTVQSK